MISKIWSNLQKKIAGNQWLTQLNNTHNAFFSLTSATSAHTNTNAHEISYIEYSIAFYVRCWYIACIIHYRFCTFTDMPATTATVAATAETTTKTKTTEAVLEYISQCQTSSHFSRMKIPNEKSIWLCEGGSGSGSGNNGDVAAQKSNHDTAAATECHYCTMYVGIGHLSSIVGSKTLEQSIYCIHTASYGQYYNTIVVVLDHTKWQIILSTTKTNVK